MRQVAIAPSERVLARCDACRAPVVVARHGRLRLGGRNPTVRMAAGRLEVRGQCPACNRAYAAAAEEAKL